jgi:hypothetical protein
LIDIQVSKNGLRLLFIQVERFMEKGKIHPLANGRTASNLKTENSYDKRKNKTSPRTARDNPDSQPKEAFSQDKVS